MKHGRKPSKKMENSMGYIESILRMKKKGEAEMEPQEKAAKMSVLQDIHKLASGALSDDVKHGLKHVEVTAPDSDSLKEGLETAKGVVDGTHGPDNSTELGEPDADDETPEKHGSVDHNLMPEAEHDDMSHDEIDSLIQALEMKKKMKK